MGLIRLLLLIAIGWLAWRLLKRVLGSSDTPPAAKPAQLVVRCSECGTHVPQADAIADAGNHFCSKDHQAQWHAKHDQPQ